MKPIELTMQAFSTYLDQTVIDFRPLNDQGLYLIAGDTGAGKTTIFDAISYALYGETSGSDRSKDVFRSQYASYDVPTQVKLVFELNHREYRVEREVAYRKSGTPRPSNDLLIEPGGKMTSGKKKVNERIKEILGVDAKQFKQIVMIAQGEFTRLLNASSKDKEKIFRDIFNTGYLAAFEKNIAKKSKEIAQQCANTQLQLDTMMKSLDLEKTTYDAEALAYLEKLIDEDEQKLVVLDKEKKERADRERTLSSEYQNHLLLNNRIDEYHRYLKARDELQEKQTYYQSLKKEIALLEDIQKVSVRENEVTRLTNERERLKKEDEQILEDQAQLKRRLDDYARQEQQLPQLEKEINDLHVTYERVLKQLKVKKDYDLLQKKIRQGDEAYQELTIKIEKEQAKISDQQNDIENDNKKINELPVLLEKQERLSEKYQVILDRIKKMHALSDRFDAFNNVNDQYLETIDQLEKYKQEIARDEAFLEEGRRLFMNDQVGFLASRLKEGEACPVCGSTHHPHLAAVSSSDWNSQAIEKLSDALKTKQQRLSVMNEQAEEKKKARDEANIQMESLKSALGLDTELSRDHFVKTLGEATRQQKDMERENDNLDNEIAFRRQLVNHQKKAQTLLNKRLEMLDELKREQDSLKEKQTADRAQAQTILTQYPHLLDEKDRRAVIKKELNEKTEQRRRIHDLKNELSGASSRLKALKEENEKNSKKAQEDYLVAKELFDQALDHLHLAKEEYLEKKASLDLLASYKDKYTQYMDELNRINGSLKALSDVAGQTKKDLTKEKEALDDFRRDQEEKDNAYATFNVHHQTMKKTYRKMQKIAKGNEAMMEENQRYHHLSEVVTGNNSAKMTFESYVLAAYFNQILAYANEELAQLTRGRYKFVRRVNTTGNGHQGLDLDVDDFETGKTRDVRSLSGGESFKASLALALGMSSMIQSMAGGIELNALFIDEGFGTLDQESLDSAVNVLLSMKSENKVIGIISHVAELENRIDAKIRVKKGHHGSHLKVEA